MADFGKAGSKAPVYSRPVSDQGDEPRTGFGSNPNKTHNRFESTKGFGGTTPPAH